MSWPLPDPVHQPAQTEQASSRPSPDLVPSVIGPFTVRLLNVEELGTYNIRVMGRDGEHTVQRSYSSFAVLGDGMGDASGRLPPMPPKSVFRKRISARFRLNRAMGLREVVRAAVAVDPHAVMPVLRLFLGLPPPTSCTMPCPAELRKLLRLSHVETVVASIYEEYELDEDDLHAEDAGENASLTGLSVDKHNGKADTKVLV